MAPVGVNSHHRSVVIEAADDRVLVKELEFLLFETATLDQLAEVPEPVRAVCQGDLASPLELWRRVMTRQVDQTLQDTNAGDPADFEHGLPPPMGLWSDDVNLLEQICRTAFNTADLLRADVLAVGAELARFTLGMHGDLNHPAVEDPDDATIPTNPHTVSQVLRRHGVVRLGHFHVTVSMDRTLRFVEEGKTLYWQRHQGGTFDFVEHSSDLLTRGTVDSRVRDRRFPMQKVAILGFEIIEDMALQAVVLDVVNSPFDFSLVTRHVRLRGQRHDPVVIAERLHLPIDLGIEPVRFRHGGAKIVEDQELWDTTEVMESVLQATNEVLGGLLKDAFAVAFTRMTQHDPKHVWAATTTAGLNDRCALPEVNLALDAGLALHPSKR